MRIKWGAVVPFKELKAISQVGTSINFALLRKPTPIYWAILNSYPYFLRCPSVYLSLDRDFLLITTI